MSGFTHYYTLTARNRQGELAATLRYVHAGRLTERSRELYNATFGPADESNDNLQDRGEFGLYTHYGPSGATYFEAEREQTPPWNR